MSDRIDRAAEAYSQAYDDAISAVVARYRALAKRSPEEVAQALSTVDFRALMRTEYGLGPALDKVAVAYAQELLATTPGAVLPSAETVEAMLRFDIDAANTQIDMTADEIKRVMMQSVLGRQSEADFAAALETATLKPHQINSYVNQNMRSFHRTVETQMAQENPADLYIWDGPLDGRTSDECRQMIAEGALTYDEWSAKYGAYLTAGTHYGCRHTLQRYVRTRQLDDAKKAREELDE